ncbi:hypothetical protein KCH_73230 [Kitasatospora cheerisanensis KCTC 2395]|uniref:Uncharacterized protein n=1 Tax=Kitasatospora cheerisanensis KCTC 2395 TaxID=1348663 RepID=A0A066YSR1_9ACTN|nr:hypothetical protein KCH_73230 [Kitasatospora cheerisanensis KCTC 2395]
MGRRGPVLADGPSRTPSGPPGRGSRRRLCQSVAESCCGPG